MMAMLLLIMTRQIYSTLTLVPSSVRTLLNYLHDLTHPSHPPNHIENIKNNSEEVFVTLAGLDPNKAVGIDNINAKILKHRASVLVQPYTSSIPTELDSPVTSARLENPHNYTSLQVQKQKCSQQLPSYLPFVYCIQSVITKLFLTKSSIS